MQLLAKAAEHDRLAVFHQHVRLGLARRNQRRVELHLGPRGRALGRWNAGRTSGGEEGLEGRCLIMAPIHNS
jgi:hypothetical protein